MGITLETVFTFYDQSEGSRSIISRTTPSLLVSIILTVDI